MFHIISCMAYGIICYQKYLMTSNFYVKFTSKVIFLTYRKLYVLFFKNAL